MCGRFVRLAAAEHYAERWQATLRTDLAASFNIAPTQAVLALRVDGNGERELVALRWGLIPGWLKQPDSRYSMINARAETLAAKPAYRQAFAQRRCLILADGFYEWQQGPRGKQPFFIGLPDRAIFAMAGVWESWRGEGQSVIESGAIITTAANPAVAEIHPRMPAIIDRHQTTLWLQGQGVVERHHLLQHLLQPYPGEMLAFAVSRHVNHVSNNDPRCLEPLANPS